MVTLALAPRPMVWARATRAPGTWRGPAVPRSWPTSSTTWPRAEAPSGSPFDSSPPERFTDLAPTAVGQHRALLARPAEPELRPREQLARRVGVLALDHVEVPRTDARGLVRVARREGRRRRDAGVVHQPGHRGRLVEHVAGQVAAQRDRAEPHAADPLGPAQHDRGRTLVRRAQHPEVERLADDPGCEHLLGGDRRPEHRVRVVLTPRPVLHHQRGEVVLGRARGRAIVRCARSAK